MRNTVDKDADSRLKVNRLATVESSNSFALDVYQGLTSKPKTLPPRYFYDELGSRLFEALCWLPEYYVTRAEREILSDQGQRLITSIRKTAGRNLRLIELGSGSSEKTRCLIEPILGLQDKLHYIPIDISLPSIEQSSDELLHDYPDLRITAYCADYLSGLEALSANLLDEDNAGDYNVVVFLGSSIGNLEPPEAQSLLREVRKIMRPGEPFLIGADLKKSLSILLPAYNDMLGVTAAFNLNLLVRINRELKGDFDLNKFEHRALYNDVFGRIEMHLFSLESQRIRIRDIDCELRFDRGESIHTENSYKFDLQQLSELAEATGFSLQDTLYDRGRLLSLNVYRAA